MVKDICRPVSNTCLPGERLNAKINSVSLNLSLAVLSLVIIIGAVICLIASPSVRPSYLYFLGAATIIIGIGAYICTLYLTAGGIKK